MEWQAAERVQKNSAGEYRAFINGQWVPAQKAQKNSAGEYRVILSDTAAPTAPAVATPPPQDYQRKPSIGERVRSVAYPVAEAVGAGLGGLVGTGVGPAGTVAGASLGYAGVKGLENIIDQYTGAAQPETLGQAAARTARDVATGATYEMGGQLLGRGLSAAAGAMAKNVKAPTVQEVRANANKAYESAKQSGATFDVSTPASNILTKIQNEIYDPVQHPKLSAAVDKLEELQAKSAQGAPAEVKDIIMLNRRFNRAVRGTPDERRIASLASTEFNNALAQINPQVMADIEQGNALWGQAAKSQRIENIVKEAEASTAPTSEAIKKKFANLLKNPTGFTKEEQAAIKDIAEGSMTTNALSLLGNLAPGKNVSGVLKLLGYEEAFKVSPTLALTAAGASAAARGTANVLAKSKANQLAEQILRGRMTQPNALVAPSMAQRITPAGLVLGGGLANQLQGQQ